MPTLIGHTLPYSRHGPYAVAENGNYCGSQDMRLRIDSLQLLPY